MNLDPKWWCSHDSTTDPDENGDAICLKCGTVVQIRFNIERFKDFCKKMLEDG